MEGKKRRDMERKERRGRKGTEEGEEEEEVGSPPESEKPQVTRKGPVTTKHTTFAPIKCCRYPYPEKVHSPVTGDRHYEGKYTLSPLI